MCKHSERKEYGGRLYSEQTLLKCQLETHFLLHKGVGNMSTISLDILYYNVGFIYMELVLDNTSLSSLSRGGGRILYVRYVTYS